MTKKVIVIGAGIAGIAASVRLAVKGYEVSVMENNAYPGGKLNEIQFNGYRFDAGPSLLTLPELIEELFLLAGKNIHDYFRYEKLDEICRYFYEDGTRITSTGNLDTFSREIEEKTGVPAKTVKLHLANSRAMYELSSRLFLGSSLHKLSSYLNKDAFKALIYLNRLKTGKIMHSENEKLFKDPRITQLFDRYATYNGSDPYKAPATLNIIPHLEYNLGAYFPSGGMYSITRSLTQLATDIGVNFKYNSPVEEILINKKAVFGVKSSGNVILADVVISNSDIHNTYKNLLPKEDNPEKLLGQEKSSSGLVFYWGIQKEFKALGLHNIFFSKDYKAEFRAIFDKATVYEDPTVYLNISSKKVPADAPAGHENWFTMINVPSDSGQNWPDLISASRKNIITKLNRILGCDISSLITCEQILDPVTVEKKTGSFRGALYGNSSNSMFSAFLRHPNFSSEIRNLYFCGGSVHPGGGIPLCLLSARIVAGLIR